jgi:oxygen-independent coproporphyrinogen-3 oxidase
MSIERLPSTPLPSGQGGAPHSGATNGTVHRESDYGSYFVAAYPPFSQWTAEVLAEYCDMLERPIPPDSATPLGLYVHIPFCVDRCRYCYYLSYGGDDRGNLDRYVDTLIAELASYGDRPAIEGRSIDFVYLGGGTPSLLSRSSLERLLEGLQGILPWSRAKEVTFECAPKSVTPAKMKLLRQYGVTRLSLGVQQLEDEVLTRSGRVYLTKDVEAAYQTVCEVGFPVVNLDLMVGLVGESRESMLRSLDRVIELGPDSVTIYQMEIPRNTPLYRDLQSGDEVEGELADWGEKCQRLSLAFQVLARAGYEHISAYALVKDRSRHDFIYQREQYHGADLIGIGASSFGYIQGIHHQNAASLRQYTEIVEAGKMPLYRAYSLGADEQLVREFVLHLKLGGCRRGYFLEKFGVDVLERFLEPLQLSAEAGWLIFDDDTIHLTEQGLSRVDHLLPSFYQPQFRDVRYS